MHTLLRASAAAWNVRAYIRDLRALRNYAYAYVEHYGMATTTRYIEKSGHIELTRSARSLRSLAIIAILYIRTASLTRRQMWWLVMEQP